MCVVICVDMGDEVFQELYGRAVSSLKHILVPFIYIDISSYDFHIILMQLTA